VHRNCAVAPAPGTDRHIGPNADGFRVVGCVNSARIEDCRAESILDDAFVVQRNRTPVVEFLDDHTIDVSRWSVHAKPGDVFDVLSPTGVRKGTLPPVESLTAKFPTPMARVKPKTLTFEEPIHDLVDVGDTIGNRETASQNFVVRNNTALNNRGKSLRIAARDGIVENNQFEGASHNTIELECDTAGHFIPNGPVEDVTVRNNTLVRSGLAWYAHSHPAAIRLHHLPHRKFNTEGQPHRNITIEDNTVRSSASTGISLQDTVRFSVSGNDLQDLNRLRYDNGGYGFHLKNVRSGKLQKNQVKGTSDTLSGFGTSSGSSEISLVENTVTIDGKTTAGSLE
jgi:parallel beta-helix repeat protein